MEAGGCAKKGEEGGRNDFDHIFIFFFSPFYIPRLHVSTHSLALLVACYRATFFLFRPYSGAGYVSVWLPRYRRCHRHGCLRFACSRQRSDGSDYSCSDTIVRLLRAVASVEKDETMDTNMMGRSTMGVSH